MLTLQSLFVASSKKACVFDGHFSKSSSFFDGGTPRYRGEPQTPERVSYHIEVRTLNARRIFREKLSFRMRVAKVFKKDTFYTENAPGGEKRKS